MDGETEGTGEAQALTFGFSFPTLLGLLPTVVLIIALATVGKESPGLSSTTSFPGDVSPISSQGYIPISKNYIIQINPKIKEIGIIIEGQHKA